MTGLFVLKVIIEVAVVLLIAYGIWNEEKLIVFENELWIVLRQWAKRGFKKGSGNNVKTHK